MKKLFSILFMTTFLFSACEGDQGPQGPPGPPGEDGFDGIDGLGYTYEQTFNFDYFADTNTYSYFINIPDEVATVNPQADAVLVYRLEVVEDNDGNDVDTWSLIPQNFFLDEGTIQYVYNHTAGDVEVLIDGNFDLSNLDSFFVENQTFRIVVLPSDTFAEDTGINVSSYNAVMNALDLKESDVKKVEAIK
ncbi:hypothetical protein J0871_14125 [Salegentibacter sp. BDJ18]|uniref:hypothetical protein n=1 Tax=Salegentibacter sp. BDJ18 TaxID=2816376 RepID=UPI001AAF8A29|nr:hypothetical protein [Salegentibacter sp. BDJ18]MBO2545556.1 hypothetical protein [Salegentibacter sp. BDJ18]|tara:strand:+ start:42 stop:614 length:573 start_codon:yes stop_codon:yes gene_type:complete